MTKNKGHDYSTSIILASVLVGTIRYAAAFLSSDVGKIEGLLSEIITFALGISGFAMGVLGTLGAAYIFDGWRQKMPASGVRWPNKFVALTAFVLATFLCEVVIIVPFTVSRIRHESIATILGNWDWLWSIAIAVMPLLLIGGVSVSNQIVTVNEGKVTGKLPESYRSEDEQHSSNWRKVRKGLSDEQVKAIATGETKSIAFNFKISDRNARNWRKYAQEEVAGSKK